MISTKRMPARAVVAADFEEPLDARLRAALDLAWPVQALLRLFVRHLGEPWLHGKITGQGIRVGRRQLSELDALNRQAAALMGVEPPALFVVKGDSLEPVLLGVSGRNTLCLTGTLLGVRKDEQLFYLLGREMAHIRAQHPMYMTLWRWLKEALGSTLRRLAFPAMALLNGWQRAAALSADRGGLIVGQDLESASKALLRAVVPADLVASVDVKRYTRDGLRTVLAHPLASAPELLEAAPYLPRRLAVLHAFRSSATWAELFP